MNPHGHSAEPPDTREQPECCCPLEGPEHLECPAHSERARVRYAEARGRFMDHTIYEYDAAIREDDRAVGRPTSRTEQEDSFVWQHFSHPLVDEVSAVEDVDIPW